MDEIENAPGPDGEPTGQQQEQQEQSEPTGQSQSAPGQGNEQAQSDEQPLQAEPAASPGVAPHRRPFRTGRVAAMVAGVAAVGLLAGGGGWALGMASAQPSGTAATQAPVSPAFLPGRSQSGTGGSASGSSASGTQTQPTATSAQDMTGVVTITTNLYYGAGEAAGTGIVVTRDGTVLTNNHVIAGATSIQVTVETTGRTYTAEVAGYDATNDVAVLRLANASGLDTIPLGANQQVATGDGVSSVGNADGTGNLVTATGTVSALDQSITVQSESGSSAENLAHLIEIHADVVSGDSGGPLLGSNGDVIGLVTAASSGSAVVTGYAIPIRTVLSVWQQVTTGTATSTVQLGSPAFLGITLDPSATGTGAGIAGVLDGGPAAGAGLAAGDAITAVDGASVASADDLRSVIAGYQPGDTVTLSVTAASGGVRDVTLTLAAGPAA